MGGEEEAIADTEGGGGVMFGMYLLHTDGHATCKCIYTCTHAHMHTYIHIHTHTHGHCQFV